MIKSAIILLFLTLSLSLQINYLFGQQNNLEILTITHNYLESFKELDIHSSDSIKSIKNTALNLIRDVPSYDLLSDKEKAIYHRIISLFCFFDQSIELNYENQILLLDSATSNLKKAQGYFLEMKNSNDLHYLEDVCSFNKNKEFALEIVNTSAKVKSTRNIRKGNDLWNISDNNKSINTDEPPVLNRTLGIPSFPWPPPAASASSVIPIELFVKTKTLYDVDRKLVKTLESCGYDEFSYYSVPQGFALVTRLEQIMEDGSPKKLPDRWKTTRTGLSELTLKAYFKALFFGNPGYFRVIAFIVSSEVFSQSSKEVSREEALAWLVRGANSLPPDFKKIKITSNHKVTALIYEFKQPETLTTALLMVPSNISGKEHLIKSNLWQTLKK